MTIEKHCPIVKSNVPIEIIRKPVPVVDGSIDNTLQMEIRKCLNDCFCPCGLQKNELLRGLGQPPLTDPV